MASSNIPSPSGDLSDNPSPSISSTPHDPIMSQLEAFSDIGVIHEESLPTPPPRSLPPLTGESTRSLHGGSSVMFDTTVEYGDQNKQHKVAIVSFPSPLEINPFCCGFVGLQKTSFCLKTKTECSSYQSNGSHYQTRFPVEPNLYYICKSKSNLSAWCQFVVPTEKLQSTAKESLDNLSRLTLEQWKALFAIANKSDEETTDEEIKRGIKLFSNTSDLSFFKTPSKSKQDLLEVKEEFRSETKRAIEYLTELKNVDWTNTVPSALATHIENMNTVIQFLIEQSERNQLDILQRAVLSDVSDDINSLVTSVSGLKASIGNNNDNLFPDLWSGMNDLAVSTNVTTLQSSINSIKQQLSAQTVQLTGNDDRWATLTNNWLPIIIKSNTSIQSLRRSIADLSTSRTPPPSTSFINNDLLSNPPSDQGALEAENSQLRSDLAAQKVEMDRQFLSLQNRFTEFENTSNDETRSLSGPQFPRHRSPHQHSGYGVRGVSYKNYHFDNEKSLEGWMREKMSHPSHGLFVDIVSFSEFFGGQSYVERNSTLNDTYLSNKIGYASMADSIVATSFQNVLPAAYGRGPDHGSGSGSSSTSDLDCTPGLPGMKTYAKWDNEDGSTGRKYWIDKECVNASRQIDNMIRSRLDGEPQYLAKELLMDSLQMSQALYTFITTSFNDTNNTGRFDVEQSWEMTSKFVKRIFLELYDVRVTARDGIHTDEPWAAAAKFLFATLKAHEIMNEYMRLNIKDHPSISSEMVKFICYSQPATDTADVLQRISNVESLQRGDQGSISRLEARIKKLEAYKSESDKIIKKLVDKHGI